MTYEEKLQNMAVEGLDAGAKMAYQDIASVLCGGEGSVVGSELLDLKEEKVAFVIRQIKDGLHPSLMDPGEQKIMFETFGQEWYLDYGYIREDCFALITIDPIPPVKK